MTNQGSERVSKQAAIGHNGRIRSPFAQPAGLISTKTNLETNDGFCCEACAGFGGSQVVAPITLTVERQKRIQSKCASGRMDMYVVEQADTGPGTEAYSTLGAPTPRL